MNRLQMATIATLTACTQTSTQTGPVETGWTQVWADEFTGAAGAPPAVHWKPDIGGDGWGNEQLEYNTDRIENAFLDGEGNLVIRAIAEEYEGNRYTSARLTTADSLTFGPARVEARIQAPAGDGIWPAFWLLGSDISTIGWPACGEIDIFELRGQEPEVVLTTVHGPGYSGADGIGTTSVLPDASASDAFHTYAVDIDPDHLVWWVDGRRVHTVRPGDLPDGTAWAFDGTFFLILNVAVGGHLVGDPTDATPFPADLRVDWVRVYERTQ